MSDAQSSLQGNCHCGRYRFQVSPDPGDAIIVCACMLCTKLGCLWLRTAPDTFTVTRDEGGCLVEYQGTKFCGHCGTAVTGEHRVGPLQGWLLVNARAGWGFDPFKVGPFEAVPALPEKEVIEPDPEVGMELDDALPAKHHGSCHCGKVRVELLADISELQVKEDNCSSCVRNAYIGVYPTKDQVRIHGREQTFEYIYGRKFNGSVHCKTCGVTVFNNVYGPPLSVFDSFPPNRKELMLAVYWKNMALQPLNVRALDDVDIRSLYVERTDEGTEGYTLRV